jgi:hypothetical protein
MASVSETTPVPHLRRRWPRRIAYAAAALATIVAMAWVAVPPIVRAQVETRLTALLDRPTTVEAVAFDPLRLRVTLGKLAIARRTEAESLLTVDELVADLSMASLWHRAPVFDGLRIVRPRVSLARDNAGRYNIQDLIEALFSKPIVLPRTSLNNIEIDDGTVLFADGVTGRTHEIAALDIGIPFLSSLPHEASIRVTPRVSGTFDGSHFALNGSSLPFAEHREAAVDIDVDALPLPPYVAYLPVTPRVDLVGGALTTRLKVVFVEAPSGERRVELRGDARIDGLAVKRRDGTPLASSTRVAVAIDALDLIRRDVRVATVAIDAPVLDVRRLADGTLESTRLVGGDAGPSPAGTAPDATGEPSWKVHVAKFNATRGTVALTDETSTFRSTLVDVAVDATNFGTKQGEKAHVKVDFVSSDRIASFSAEGDVEPMVPAATGRFTLSKFSLGLLFPFYRSALAVDVQKGSLDFASAFTLDADGNVRLTGGEATIADLRLALPGAREPLWRIPQMALSAIDVDVGGRKVTIGEVRSRGAALRLAREPDGTLEMARIVRTAADGKPAGDAAWTLLMRKLAVDGLAIDFEDRVPQPPVRVAVRELAATVTDASNAAGTTAKMALRARIGRQGRLAFSGPVSRQPMRVSGQVDLSGFPLAALRPYVEPHVNVVVTDGTLRAKGRLVVEAPEGGDARASWQGDVSIADFAALDKPTSSDLARWKSLALERLDVTTRPFRIGLGRIGVDDFFARVIIYPDATLNLLRLLTPGASPEPAPGAIQAATGSPAGQPTTPREALPISIGRVDLSRGNVNFTDLFVKPNYSVNLTDITGSVTMMSTEQAGDVAISARINHTAPVEVQGRLHPFAKELSLDLAAKAIDIDLPPLTPYSAKYAGYGIEKGQLTFDVRYRIENRRLAAENRLVLDQLTFGERVESPTATKLPVLLAVALLKDSRGVIDIRLPISGSLDDPEFSMGGIIIRVIVNLITKAVTAPFALLGAAFGGGEELSTLDFAAGSAALGPEAQKRVDTLGKALADRPALKLDIAGRADPAADGDALRHAAVEAAMRREKMKALVAAGTAPASIEQVAIDPEERDRWLAAAYREAPIPDRPRNVVRMLKDLPPAEMQAMLLAHAKVDDGALRALANARALGVKDALAAKGIADDRLFLLAPRIGGEAAGTAAAASAARVDLSLR